MVRSVSAGSSRCTLQSALPPRSSPKNVRSRSPRTLTIPVEHAGQRLDQVLAELLSDYSRTRIKDWIEAGEVLVDGDQLRPKDKVLGGEQRRGQRRARRTSSAVAPEPIELNIVHQDAHVLVINKPAGLVVHPGAGNAAGTLQNALLHSTRSWRRCRAPASSIGSTRTPAA